MDSIRKEMRGAVALVTLTRPDDWHLHLRDGAATAAVLNDTVRRFGRAIVISIEQQVLRRDGCRHPGTRPGDEVHGVLRRDVLANDSQVWDELRQMHQDVVDETGLAVEYVHMSVCDFAMHEQWQTDFRQSLWCRVLRSGFRSRP